MTGIQAGDIVQFRKGHKWFGCLGIIQEASSEKYLIWIGIPEENPIYIFDDGTEIIKVGTSYWMPKEDNEEES